MKRPREKALTQFPAMYITLVSVVQAIALEALASRALDLAPGLDLGISGSVVWLQILLLAQTVFYVWVSYTLLVTLAQWIFRVFDFGAAFAVGAIQFVAIDLVGKSLEGFLVTVAMGFLVGGFVSHSNIGAAASTPENRSVLRSLPRTRLTVLLLSVGVLGALGIAAVRMDAGLGLVALVLGSANAVLLVAQLQWFRWWKEVLAPRGIADGELPRSADETPTTVRGDRRTNVGTSTSRSRRV